MARLRVVSDLHEEVSRFPGMPDAEFDVLVCAGDVVESDPVASALRLAELAQGRPAVWVLGNHDVWGVTYEDAVESARQAGLPRGVHLLQDSEVSVEGLTFLGATLWTDGFLNQPPIEAGHWSGLPIGCRMSLHGMPGEFGEPIWLRGSGIDRRAKRRDIFRMHEKSSDWLALRLQDGADRGEEMVVVTHYAPTPRSVANLSAFPLSAAMSASDLGLVDLGQARLWVHGHVHASLDIDAPTRVVCNPRGSANPNASFDPGFTIELAAPEPSLNI